MSTSPGGSENLQTKLGSLDTEIDSLETQTQINTTSIAANASAIGIQTSRLDNLAGNLEEGSTTFDAEIVDARTDYEGGIASSLGVGIREHFKKINDEYEIGKNMYNPNTSTIHSLVSIDNGEVTEYSDSTSVGYKYITSDFIKIKAGVTIAFNGQRLTAVYNNEKQFYEGFQEERNGPFINPSYPTVYTPPIDGYIRTSVAIVKEPSFQIEEGNSVTNFEPYRKEWKYLKNSEVVTNLKEEIDNNYNFGLTSDKVNQNMYFTEPGWNMVNKFRIKLNWFIMGGTNVTDYIFTDGLSLNNYFTTQPMAVEPGKKYTFRCRAWKTYGKDGMKKRNTNAGYNHSLTTITIQNDEYFLAISDGMEWLSIARCEEGEEETSPYENFKIEIPGLEIPEPVIDIPISNMILVEKNGEYVNLTKAIDDDKVITIQTQRYGSGNKGFNFIKTQFNNEDFHSTLDDITPLRTFQTVGANHLYTCWVQNELGNLTVDDLGSIWTDGNHNFCLIDIVNNKPYFMADYYIDNNIINANNRVPITNLTHVSGATHTTSITKEGETVSNAIRAEYIRNVDYYMDNNKLETDGKYYTDNIKVIENYSILSYKGIYDWAVSHIGSNYKENLADIDVTIEQSNIYAFDNELTCIITSNITAVEKVHLQDCGFLQSYKINGATRYMFGINPINNQDFTQGINVSNITTSLIVSKTYWRNENIAPSYYIDYLVNKGLSFTMGYLPEFSSSSIATRKDIISNRAWELRDTGKSYPIAISNQTLQPGDSLTFKGFRKYIKDNSNFTIKLKDMEYYFINGIEASTYKTISNYLTKGEILASDRFTIKNLDSITYAIEKGGYAIIKKVNE